MPALRADLDAGDRLNVPLLHAAEAAEATADALRHCEDLARSVDDAALQAAVTNFGVVASGRVRVAAAEAKDLGSDVTNALTLLRRTEHAVAAAATAK